MTETDIPTGGAEASPPRAVLNIGEFDMDGGRRYRVYADPEWMLADDRVTVSRVLPDPARGKKVMAAKGLDTSRPVFEFPDGWSEADQATAASGILRSWRSDWRASTFDWDLAAHVLPVYIESRRLRLLLRPGTVIVTAELTYYDEREPTWVGTFYRLDRENYGSRDRWPLMRISWACRDWLGKHDGDRVGSEAQRRLREAARLLWTSTIAPKRPDKAPRRP